MKQDRRSIDQAWNTEYGDAQFLKQDSKPQGIVRTWLKEIRKNYNWENLSILDIGCGDGRTSIFCAERGATVYGLEISSKALQQAKQSNLPITWIHQSAADPLPIPDESIDIVFDVMGTITLSEVERAAYLKEIHRVLKKGGLMYTRTLCIEGDGYIKSQIQNNPGKEVNTYIHETLRIQETAFTTDTFKQTYKDFKILDLTKQTHFQKSLKGLVKRNYFIGKLEK